MKILVLSNLYPPHVLGGYEILCAQVCSAYARRGHEVVVLTSAHGSAAASSVDDPELIDGVRVHRALELHTPFGKPVRRRERSRRRMVGQRNAAVTARILSRWRPDIVHVWSQLRLTIAPAQECRRHGLSLVFSFNDEHISGYLPMSFSFDPRRLFGWFLDKFVYPEITLSALPISAATAISEVTKRNLLKVGIRSSRFSVIYQGIPAQDFPGKPTPGTCNVPLRLLFVGQILRYKGVHTVVAAAHRLATTGLGVSLTIAGAGDDAYESELRVLAAGGPASVTFAGHVPRGHISQLYRDHDVFVFASTWEEPFGLTHLEAMASGLPVVSTLCGGQREFLRPEVNCLAYEPEDDEMLARQIRRLSDSPDLSERIARTGQEVTINQFSVERYTDELLALLEVSRR